MGLEAKGKKKGASSSKLKLPPMPTSKKQRDVPPPSASTSKDKAGPSLCLFPQDKGKGKRVGVGSPKKESKRPKLALGVPTSVHSGTPSSRME